MFFRQSKIPDALSPSPLDSGWAKAKGDEFGLKLTRGSFFFLIFSPMNFTSKTIIYVFGFILTCLLGFYVIGFVKPSVHFETTISINRSVKQSWNVFSTEHLMKEWMPGFVKTEAIKGVVFSKGSEFKLHMKENAQDYIMIERVIDVIPEQRYEFELENGIIRNHVIYQFKETQAFSTEITIYNEASAQNWFFRSLFVFLKSDFKKQDEAILQSLKKLVEMDITNVE